MWNFFSQPSQQKKQTCKTNGEVLVKSRRRTHKGSFEAMLTTLRNFHHSHERQKQRQKQRQSTENDETIKQLIWLLATDLSDEKNF